MIRPISDQSPGVLWLFIRIGGKDFILGAVIVLVLTAVSYHHLVEANRFATEGMQAVAQVENAYTSERRKDNKTVTDFHLDLAFTTAQGGVVAVSEKVSRAMYERAREEGEIELWYLASDPQKVELAQGSVENRGKAAQWFGLLMGVIWLAVLWFSGRKAVAGYLARQHGRLGTADVLSLETIQTRKEGVWYRLVWRDDAGRVCKSLRYRAGYLDGYGPGKRLDVYHGPKRSWWDGDVGTRV